MKAEDLGIGLLKLSFVTNDVGISEVQVSKWTLTDGDTAFEKLNENETRQVRDFLTMLLETKEWK